MSGLKAFDPARDWRRRSVYSWLQLLKKGGMVKCMKRNDGKERAVYARADLTLDVPFEGMTLAEVVADVLSDGPKTPTEIVVTMLEAGYSSRMARKTLVSKVGVELRRDSERFTRQGRKWSLV